MATRPAAKSREPSEGRPRSRPLCPRCAKIVHKAWITCPYCSAPLRAGAGPAPGRASGASVYAGFWRRAAALAIDYCVIAVASTVVTLPIRIGMWSSPGDFGVAEGVAAIVIVLFIAAYFVVMDSSRHQGTLGKVAVGISVTDLEGRRISLRRSLKRTLAKGLLLLLTLGTETYSAVYTRQRQTGHDMVADTLVLWGGPGNYAAPPPEGEDVPGRRRLLGIILTATLIAVGLLFMIAVATGA